MPAPYSITLLGLLPPPRYPPAPGAWTQVTVEEAATREAAVARLGTVLATIPLDPIDANPAAPAARNFTIANAQLASGWYLVVFEDAAGAESVSDPLAGSAPGVLPPDTTEMRTRSRLLRAQFPATSTDPDSEPDLRQITQDATALVEAWTGRQLDATLPDDLVDLGYRAIVLTAEMGSVTGSVTEAEAAAGGKRIRSQSAGPWSVTYFGPGEVTLKNGIVTITGNALLDSVLWALMTEEKREEWYALATGVQAPAGAASTFDYRRQGGGYSGLHRGAAGFRAGPDGF